MPKKEDHSDKLTELFDDGTRLETGIADSTQLDSTRLNSTQLDSTYSNPIPIAAAKDFNRRPNSLERDALPKGLFPGTSKKLYDALFLRTRGAVVPVRSIKATRTDLMQWAGIGGLNTFLAHIKHLTRIGLINRTFEVGDKEGAIYEVRIPEEIDLSLVNDSTQLNSVLLDSTQLNSTSNRVHDSTQKLSRVESSKPIDSKDTYENHKTSLKTLNTDDDREALSDFLKLLREASEELMGRVPRAGEREQWAEVARIIVAELKHAAERAGTISSVPAFLAAHLRRKFAHKPRQRQGEGNLQPSPTQETPPIPVPGLRLTTDEIAEQSRLIIELLESGYTMEQAESQFSRSFHHEDWQKIQQTVSIGIAEQVKK